jgi:hypothetical protein
MVWDAFGVAGGHFRGDTSGIPPCDQQMRLATQECVPHVFYTVFRWSFWMVSIPVSGNRNGGTFNMTRKQRRHSQMVLANVRATQARRRQIATDFRARLTAEIGPGTSIAREALIDSAVSAYTEIVEVSDRFLRCRASADAMSRLSIARGQLARTLRALGVERGGSAPDDPMAALRALESQIVAARTPATESEVGDVEATET